MEKNAAPTRNITTFEPETERERKRRNGTSGVCATFSSMKVKIAEQHGRGREDRQRVRRAPRVGVGADDGEDQCPQAGRDGDRSPDVELGRVLVTRGRFGLGQVVEGGHGGGDTDGDVDEQDPTPRQLGRQDTAQDHAGGAAGSGHGTPDAEGLDQPDARKGRHDDGERGG